MLEICERARLHRRPRERKSPPLPLLLPPLRPTGQLLSPMLLSVCCRDPYLQGSFAPVHKEVLEEVKVVEGKLPGDMAGAYMRTGAHWPRPKQGLRASSCLISLVFLLVALSSTCSLNTHHAPGCDALLISILAPTAAAQAPTQSRPQWEVRPAMLAS